MTLGPRKRFQFEGFSVAALPGWRNSSEQNSVFTLEKTDVVGALQFSAAIYKSGAIPNPSKSDLNDLVRTFVLGHATSEPFDETSYVDSPLRTALSCRMCDDFVRAWYVSVGGSFVKATYLCEWGEQNKELKECEEIIASLRFG